MLFLSEAFTRPRVTQRLAKAGFTQAYTYFTWRNTKEELQAYLEELTEYPVHEYFGAELLAEHSGYFAGEFEDGRQVGVSGEAGAGGDDDLELWHLRRGV